jgi:hypothetical protein
VENSWEDEKGIEEEENLDEDVGVGRSSYSVAFAGGGEASLDFSSQKNLSSAETIQNLQIFPWAQLQHEE